MENAQHLVGLGMPFSPLAIPDMLACMDIDRQENVSAYLGLLVNSLQLIATEYSVKLL